MTLRNLREVLSTEGFPAERFDDALERAGKLTEQQWRESEGEEKR